MAAQRVAEPRLGASDLVEGGRGVALHDLLADVAGVVHDDGSQFSDEEADPTLTEDEASRRRIARLGPDTFRSNLEREEQPRSLVFLVVMATALACYAFWRDGM